MNEFQITHFRSQYKNNNDNINKKTCLERSPRWT